MKKMYLITLILVIALVSSLAATTVLYIDNQNLNKDKQTAAQNWANRNTYTEVSIVHRGSKQWHLLCATLDQIGALHNAYGFGANNVWNQSALEMLGTARVDMNLVYGYVDQATNATVVLSTVTEPQASYTHVTSNGVTYRYMWQIIAYDAASEIMPLTHDGYCLIDAATGESLPVPAS